MMIISQFVIEMTFNKNSGNMIRNLVKNFMLYILPFRYLKKLNPDIETIMALHLDAMQAMIDLNHTNLVEDKAKLLRAIYLYNDKRPWWLDEIKFH